MAEVRSNGHAVVIAGGGPTGSMLAAELTLAGIGVVVIERRANHDLDGSRAGGLHARTIEVLDQRGVAERFLEEGQPHPAVGYAYNPLDVSDFPTRHNYVLALWQRDTERILAGWLEELGVPMLRGREVVGFSQDDDGVDVELSDDTTLRTAFLVGCDGGRSLVRKVAGIEFPGLDPSARGRCAERRADPPRRARRVDRFGHRPRAAERALEVVRRGRGRGECRTLRPGWTPW